MSETDAPTRRDASNSGPPERKSKGARRLVIGAVALCVAAGLIAYGLVLRSRINTDLAAKADREALPHPRSTWRRPTTTSPP